MGGLGQTQVKAFRQNTNASRKPRGRATSSSITSSQSWPGAGYSASSAFRFSKRPRLPASVCANVTAWRERSSSARAAGSRFGTSVRSTEIASTLRRGQRAAARRRRGRCSVSRSTAPAAVSLTVALVVARIPKTSPELPDPRPSCSLTTGLPASVSRTRPRLWAAITMPFAQRRLPVCQTQPASVRSSAGSEGPRPVRASWRRAVRPSA